MFHAIPIASLAPMTARGRPRTRFVPVLVAVCAWALAARNAGAQDASATARVRPAPRTASAFADTSRPVLFLKETVVTGARYPRALYDSPQALSFVSRLQIREQAPTALGDVLATLPGVDNSKDSPWEQRPVLRGLSGQRVLVLMDGSPMNSARGNGPHPSLLDPAQVERIEVVRGPSSVAYGSDALGGVINIITREAQFRDPAQRFRGSATLGGSSADRQRNGSLELMPRVGKLSAFLSGGGRKAEDFRVPDEPANPAANGFDPTPDGKVPHSGFSDLHALANLRYDFTDRADLKAGYQQYRGRDIGIPGLSFAFPGFEQAFAFPFYDRDAAHLTLEHRYLRGWLADTRLKAYWQREHRNFFSHERGDVAFLPPGPPLPPGATTEVTDQDRYFDLATVGFQAQATSVRHANYLVTLGLDFAQDVTKGDNVRKRTFYDASDAALGPAAVRLTASVPHGRFDTDAGFVQGEWTLAPQWTLSAGGRYTHFHYRTDAGINVSGFPFVPTEKNDDAVCGSAGLVFAATPDLHLTANVATGFRQPNAQDLFFSGPASVGFVIGNAALDPEKSVSYDAGVRWGPGKLAFAGDAFYSTYRDLIDAVSVPPPPQSFGQPTYQYVNISEARIWGAEAEAEWRFLPQWSARATATGAVGDITNRDAIEELFGASLDRAPLPNVPPFKGTASLRWTTGSGRLWIEPSARYSWRTNRLPLPTPGVGQLTDFKKEWIVADLFAGARMGAQRATLGVRNVANRWYRQPLASLPDPGVSVVGQLSTDF